MCNAPQHHDGHRHGGQEVLAVLPPSRDFESNDGALGLEELALKHGGSRANKRAPARRSTTSSRSRGGPAISARSMLATSTHGVSGTGRDTADTRTPR